MSKDTKTSHDFSIGSDRESSELTADIVRKMFRTEFLDQAVSKSFDQAKYEIDKEIKNAQTSYLVFLHQFYRF